MKHAMYWMIAALALGLVAAGCGKSPPAETEETAAALPAEAALEAAQAEAAPALAAAEAPAPAVELPALSEAEAAVVVAKVNDKEVTEGDIHKILSLFMKQMGGQIPPSQLEAALPRIRERIVEELVMRRVMLDEVAKQGISLSEAEFNDIKAELAGELPPGKTLDAYMAETGTTEAEMREQMAVRKMVLAKAEALAKPTDEQIQKFYDENKEGFAQGETVAAAHILIKVDPADDEAAKAAKRARLEGLRQELLAGADFAEVAKANSDCPSASSGGDLGTFGRGQMVSEFEDAAFSQPTGSVGEIVETQFGYHLIKVSAHQEAKTLDFNEAKDRIREILYSQNQQDAVKEYVDGLREGARIERFDQPPEEQPALELEVDEEAETDPPAAEVPAAGETPEAEPAPEVYEAVEEAVEAAAPAIEAEAEAAAVEEAENAAPAEEAAPAVLEESSDAGIEAAPPAEEPLQ